MTRGIRLEPKIDITYTVRDLTLDSVPIFQEVLGRAFADVKKAIELRDPTTAKETAIEIAEREPSFAEIKEEMVRRAMVKTDGNIRAAAKLLGVAERSMYRWLRDMGTEAIT